MAETLDHTKHLYILLYDNILGKIALLSAKIVLFYVITYVIIVYSTRFLNS